MINARFCFKLIWTLRRVSDWSYGGGTKNYTTDILEGLSKKTASVTYSGCLKKITPLTTTFSPPIQPHRPVRFFYKIPPVFYSALGNQNQYCSEVFSGILGRDGVAGNRVRQDGCSRSSDSSLIHLARFSVLFPERCESVKASQTKKILTHASKTPSPATWIPVLCLFSHQPLFE